MTNNIIFEDASILAAVKPQGMPAQPDLTGDRSFLEEMEAYTGQPLGLLHRLDRPVGGVMLFAKTKQAEAVLAKDIQEKRLQKSYLAVLTGKLPQEQGRQEDFLRKNGRTNLSEIVPKGTRGAKRAMLEYRRLAEKETDSGMLTLAEISLLTGRHHQIRVQTSGMGAPIWGDRKYNPRPAQPFGNASENETAVSVPGTAAGRAILPVLGRNFAFVKNYLCIFGNAVL